MKKSPGFLPLLGGVIVVGATLGGGYFLLDQFLDRQAKEHFEQKITAKTGAAANCEKADVQLFKGIVTFNNCTVSNLPSFPSPYLVKITALTFQARSFQKEIKELTLEGLDLRVDVQANFSLQNLLNPQAIFPINLLEALSHIQELQETQGNQPAQGEFKIDRMALKNMMLTVDVQNLGQKQLPLQDILLTDVTHENLSEKLGAELKGQLNTALQAWFQEEGQTFSQQMLNQLLPILQQSLNGQSLNGQGLPLPHPTP
jgi:hypothetical protein